MILEFSQQNNLENILFLVLWLTRCFHYGPVSSGASQRLGIFEDERLESVDILESFLGPTSDQENTGPETRGDGENKMSLLYPLVHKRHIFTSFKKKIFFSTIDTLSPWDRAINLVRSVKNVGERYNDRSLKISLCVQQPVFLSH